MPTCVQRHDVRVIQRGHGARLTLEPPQPLRIGADIAWQDLDGDVTAEAGVLREVDLAHAARAERRENLVGAKPRAGRKAHRVGIILSNLPASYSSWKCVVNVFQDVKHSLRQLMRRKPIFTDHRRR